MTGGVVWMGEREESVMSSRRCALRMKPKGMGGMRRRLILLALPSLLAGWMAGPGPAPVQASCAMLPSPEAALKQSDAVFAGTVLSVEDANRSDAKASAEPVRVTFRVTEAWKGVNRDRVTVRAAASDIGNYRMAEGRELIVYADKTWFGLSIGPCTRTAWLEHAAEDLAFLGAGKVPQPAPGPGGFRLPDAAGMRLLPVGAALAVAAAAAAALLFLRRRRRH
ncbi:MAG: hypothetical protein A9Z00_02950 [Thermobacillus sp. ZCTH02-B1]|nr:MAG: hypothetical protein A9Z00_02950 [Thermobacillus sp. ZCTH02-B1]